MPEKYILGIALLLRWLLLWPVQSNQASTRLNARQDFPGMSAEAQRAIHRHLAWLGREHLQDFRNHDRAVHPGGRFPGRQYFGDGFRVAGRVVLLVFLVEAARVPPRVTRTPPMGRSRIGRWLRNIFFGHSVVPDAIIDPRHENNAGRSSAPR